MLKRFLASFFFYNMGVQTVMYMATYFAADELKMKSLQLILTILIKDYKDKKKHKQE